MLMIYGMFVFELKTIPFQKISETINYRYPSNNRFGERSATQFVGVGEEKITLSGVLYPEVTGGRVSLELYRRQVDLGIAWTFINGSGLLLDFMSMNRYKPIEKSSLVMASRVRLILPLA